MKSPFIISASGSAGNVHYHVRMDAIDWRPLSLGVAQALASHLNDALHLFEDNNGLCDDFRCKAMDRIMRRHRTQS